MKYLLLIFGGLLPVIGFSQLYSVDWYKVSGGGGTSTGGVYSVSGTIGQSDAGSLVTGGNYSLAGGFWVLYALQTPGAPLLSIQTSTNHTALVSWPSPSPGFVLQLTTDLTMANWSTPPKAVQDDGTMKFITVNLSAGNRFFRLKHQ